MKELTVRHKAYIAGLVDGEGTIRFANAPSRESAAGVIALTPSVSVSNSDMRVHHWLHYTTGIGAIDTTDAGTERHKPRYAWRLRANEIKEFLEAILDDLVIKRDQAILVLEFLSTEWECPLTEEQKILRMVMLDEMTDLNKKGPSCQ